MDIRLTPEQERIVLDEIESGHFRSVEELISEALQALREKEQSTGPALSDGAQREAVREMRAFADENHVHLEGLSVRQLIHEGHRL